MDNEGKELQKENAAAFDTEIEQYSEDLTESTPDQFADTISENKTFMQHAREIADKGLTLISNMITSENEDTKQIYELQNKTIDLDANDDQELHTLEQKIQEEISNVIHDPDMSAEEKDTYVNQWEEYYQIVKEGHNESKDRRQNAVETQINEADKKREQHKRIIEALCLFGLSAISGYTGIKLGQHSTTLPHKK